MPSRNIPQPAFAGDDGSADPAVTRAIAEAARDRSTEPELLRVLSRARLLVPVVAVPGAAATGADGLRREKSSDMAVLTLTVPSGRRALPVFTSADRLALWRPDARPVAVTPAQTLHAAVGEGADTLVLDLAGPVTYELAGPALRALAAGGAPLAVPAVTRALDALLRAEPAVAVAHLVPGAQGSREDGGAGAGDSDGTLVLLPDPDAAQTEVVTRLARALAADGTLRAHLVRGLHLAVLPPGSSVPGEPFYRRPVR